METKQLSPAVREIQVFMSSNQYANMWLTSLKKKSLLKKLFIDEKIC
jgi:hypothetical protein